MAKYDITNIERIQDSCWRFYVQYNLEDKDSRIKAGEFVSKSFELCFDEALALRKYIIENPDCKERKMFVSAFLLYAYLANRCGLPQYAFIISRLCLDFIEYFGSTADSCINRDIMEHTACFSRYTNVPVPSLKELAANMYKRLFTMTLQAEMAVENELDELLNEYNSFVVSQEYYHIVKVFYSYIASDCVLPDNKKEFYIELAKLCINLSVIYADDCEVLVDLADDCVEASGDEACSEYVKLMIEKYLE